MSDYTDQHELVFITHAGIDSPGQVPRSAVPFHEANGWSVVEHPEKSAKVRRAVAAPDIIPAAVEANLKES